MPRIGRTPGPDRDDRPRRVRPALLKGSAGMVRPRPPPGTRRRDALPQEKLRKQTDSLPIWALGMSLHTTGGVRANGMGPTRLREGRTGQTKPNAHYSDYREARHPRPGAERAVGSNKAKRGGFRFWLPRTGQRDTLRRASGALWPAAEVVAEQAAGPAGGAVGFVLADVQQAAGHDGAGPRLRGVKELGV